MSEPRPKSHEIENENMKANNPPRPKTEPAGSEGSSDTHKTASDPATGTPH